MDAGATISALERAAKQEGEKLRVAKRKLAQAEKQADTDRQAICLWLRMVWLLSAGHPHVMTCAWRVRQDDLASIWNPSDVTMEQIWNILGSDFVEERLSDAEAFSLMSPSSKGGLGFEGSRRDVRKYNMDRANVANAAQVKNQVLF